MAVQKVHSIGDRRRYLNATGDDVPKRKIVENSPILVSFKDYQEKLDSRYDKYERLMKCSRDMTIANKRIIFLLQRISGTVSRDQIFKEADAKFLEVKEMLKKIASELLDDDPYLFNRAFSPGIQEYIEALSFYFYLKYKSLISFEEVMETCTFSNTEANNLVLNPFDYILGIADLTGELMRLCINSAAKGDRDVSFEVCNFLRKLHNTFASLGSVSKDLSSKLKVMKASLKKVEAACYTVKVRGSEIPQFALADMLNSAVVDPVDY